MRVAIAPTAFVAALLLSILVHPAAARAQAAAPADTVRLAVGSPLVDGNVYRPHAARVVRLAVRGERTDTTAVWTNRLAIGDSAGRRVHRWHTAGWGMGPGGKRMEFELRTTFDATTLALLGHAMRSSSGAAWRLAVDGRAVRGERRTAEDGAVQPVELTLPEAGFAAGAADLIPYAMKLRDGLTISLPLWSPPNLTVYRELWTVAGRDTVTMAGRRLPSVVMEHFRPEDGERLGRIWFVDEPPYVVRWDLFGDDGLVVRMLGEPVSEPVGGR